MPRGEKIPGNKLWKSVEKATKVLNSFPMNEIYKTRSDPNRQAILKNLHNEIQRVKDLIKE